MLREFPIGHLHIVWIADGIIPGSELWEEAQNQRCQRELYQHVEAGGEQREVEIEMFGVEHPLIILRAGSC